MLSYYLKKRDTFHILTIALSIIMVIALIYLLAISPWKIYSMRSDEGIDYTDVHLVFALILNFSMDLALFCYSLYCDYNEKYQKELRYEHLRNNLPKEWIKVTFCINENVWKIFSLKIREAYVKSSSGNSLDLKIIYKNKKEKIFTIPFDDALNFIYLKNFS